MSSMVLPPTELFPVRSEVERANSSRLASLKSPPFVYIARDSGSASLERRKTVLAGMVVPERVSLKTGAQVMLVRNVDEKRGLVNGAVGRVLGFHPVLAGKAEGVVREVTLDADGKPVQPLTGSSSSGKENQSPPSTSDKPISANGRGKEKELKMGDELFPLVEFLTPLGKETVIVTRDEFRVEDNEGTVLARRVQVSSIVLFRVMGPGQLL